MENANRRQIGFYLERARESGGAALELGCGTGVLSVALALADLDVVGLDPSDALIAQALERRKALGISPEKCRFERGDLRSARLGRTFGFVYAPSDAVLSMTTLEDVEAFFATARAHLEKDGTFAFDLRRTPEGDSGERPMRSAIERRTQAVRRPHLVSRRVGKGRESMHRLSLLAPTNEELSAALANTGFNELERWGDFGDTPASPESDRLVVVAGAI